MNKLKFGQAVSFSIKQCRYRRCQWIDEAMPETHGIFLGYRTTSEGRYWYEDGYIPVKYKKVALVAYHERKNPVFVLPEHLSIV